MAVYRSVYAATNCITREHALRRQNVTAFAVSVQNQSNVCATVWIVFDTLNLAGDAVFVALKIDNTVVVLVTAAHVTCCDTTLVVTTTGLVFLL